MLEGGDLRVEVGDVLFDDVGKFLVMRRIGKRLGKAKEGRDIEGGGERSEVGRDDGKESGTHRDLYWPIVEKGFTLGDCRGGETSKVRYRPRKGQNEGGRC